MMGVRSSNLSRHKNSGHQGEMKSHVKFIATKPKYARDVSGPLIGFGEQHPA